MPHRKLPRPGRNKEKPRNSLPSPEGRERAGVVRRGPEARKTLPADLEAFARGDDDALWRRERRRGRVDDPRPVASTLVPGVANRDARAVYEARVRRLRGAMEAGDEHALAEELAEAVQLGVWRGHSVVDFDAFAEAVLGIAADRARALAARGAAAIGAPSEMADEATVALWMRAEAGVLEATPEARVTLRAGRLLLDVPLARAAAALAGAGRRAAPLAKRPAKPEVVVDRPPGVRPLSRLLHP